MSMHLRKAVGSLMVVGLSGHQLSAIERAWLRLIAPSGIILFTRNIQDDRQTHALLNDAADLCAPNAFRCVDVEGGSVDRLRTVLAPMPSAQRVANTGNPARMRAHGELIARALRAFGFNTTLAPVLDLSTPLCAGVLGSRTASSNPEEVVQYTRQFLAGLARHGVIGCGKHFPGLGSATLDSHLVTPSIARSWHSLWNEDLAPYRELHRELPMIMVNHAAYPETPGKEKPASISPFWITTVLRKRMSYQGIIFSDDMEMGGILNSMPIEEAAIAALRAGIDLIEICHSPALILGCYESLLREAERSARFRALLLSRAATVASHRSHFFVRPLPVPLSQKKLEALRVRIFRFSEQVEKDQSA